MWVTDSDLWETCLLVALLGCLWLVVWRRMSIRTSQRRQRRDRSPPGSGSATQARARQRPSVPSPAEQTAPLEEDSGPPDAGAVTQDPQEERVAPSGLAVGVISRPEGVTSICGVGVSKKVWEDLDEVKMQVLRGSTASESRIEQLCHQSWHSCCSETLSRQSLLLLSSRC